MKAQKRLRPFQCALTMVSAILLAASSASYGETVLAGIVRSDGSNYGGLATASEVAQVAGNIKYVVDCPEQRTVSDFKEAGDVYGRRIVRAYLGNPGIYYRDMRILTKILNGAIVTALSECPIEFSMMGNASDYERVGRVDIFGSMLIGQESKLLAQAFSFSGKPIFSWWRIVDVYADEEKAIAQAHAQEAVEQEAQADEVARQAAADEVIRQTLADESARKEEENRREAEQQLAINAYQIAAAERQNARAIANAERRVRQEELGRDAVKWVKIVAGLFMLFWLWSKREAILRFYYFTFHPHPAESMVRSMIASGGSNIGATADLANALGEAPPTSMIFQKVRLEQTEQLLSQIRATNAAREREFARQAQSDAIASYEREAFYGAQTAMAHAVEALEKSKRAYATATELRRSQA